MAEKRAPGKAKSQRVFGQGAGRRKTPYPAGLYARVSTHDQQTLPLQSRAMREYAARRGWSIAVQVKEMGSAHRNVNSGRSCWRLRAAAKSM